jgi:hypothetical protein
MATVKISQLPPAPLPLLGANLVPVVQGGTTSQTTLSAITNYLSVKNYGAVGNGVADDTVAIQAALAAASPTVAVYFPPGNYKITSQITFSTNNVCIIGDGSSQVVITYAGASTTNDIFVMGNNVNALVNLIIKGIRITSTVTMTGGFAFRFRLLVRSYINDVILEGQDGNSPPKLYGGFWFDGVDNVQLTQYQIVVLNEGIRVNGRAGVGVPKAGLFINDGKIAGGTIGVRVGGAFGGIYVDMSDIIVCSVAGVKIDTGVVAEGNREIFLGQTCVIDGCGYGVHITDALGGGATLQMTGTWVASSVSHGVYFDNCASYIATMAGCIIFNNGGDAVKGNIVGPAIILSGSTIRNNGGYGVNGGVNGNGFRTTDCLMFNNALGDIASYANQFSALSDYIRVNKEIRISETDATASGRKFTISTGTNVETSFIGNSNAALSTNMLVLSALGIGNSTAYDYISAGNTSGGSFRVRGDGQIFADSGTIITPADYAEMFEWVDGNPNNEDRVGCTVSLVGNKVKIAENGEHVMGVVSAVPMIVGDAAPFRWQDAFLKDDFGRTLKEDVEVLEWVEIDPGEFHLEEINGKQIVVLDRQGGEKTHSYVHDEIPDGVVVPANAIRKTITRSVKNPAWDQSQQYISRHDRPEWAIIGLLGKLRIKSGQVTNPSWLKLRIITTSISEWLFK